MKFRFLFTTLILFCVKSFGAPAIVAHRGDEESFVEHTPSAFLSAVNKKADFIEMDLRRTSDGVFIVHHDAFTGHVTTCAGGEVNISEKTYEYISTNCAVKNAIESDIKILTFKQTLELLNGSSVGLVLDVKPEVGPENILEVLNVLSTLDPDGKCQANEVVPETFNCFKNIYVFANNFEAQDKLMLESKETVFKNMTFTKIFGDISLALENPTKFADQEAIAFSINQSTPEKILSVKKQFPHLKLLAWTLSNSDQFALAAELNLDGVITSKLSEARKFFKK